MCGGGRAGGTDGGYAGDLKSSSRKIGSLSLGLGSGMISNLNFRLNNCENGSDGSGSGGGGDGGCTGEVVVMVVGRDEVFSLLHLYYTGEFGENFPIIMGELLKNSIFFSDQHLCHADILPPSEVRARMEVAILSFLRNLSSTTPSVSDLPLISRKMSNSRVRRGLLTDSSRIFLSRSLCTKSLMNENSANSFIRVWKVMEMCYQILVQEKKVTQRELFYKLLCDSPRYFTSQSQVNRSVQDLVALLRCSRYSLGIMASSRGAVAGRLLLKEPNQEVVDCSTCGSSGYAISGDLDLLEKLVLKSDARYIIVVEKHAIFQRLAEDRVFNQIPCILITAKGYPDIGTRLLLHRMSREFPQLPILGLVDWNPAGLAILCTFKFGSVSMGLEAYRYACNVKWLGLRKDDIEQLIPEESLIPLKPRDHQIAKSLVSSEILQDDYKEELAVMVETGQRAEIEALYFHGYDFLAKYIAKKIVQASYI